MQKRNYFPRIMKGTSVFTAGSTIVLCLLYHQDLRPWIPAVAITFGTTCYHFSMRLLVGLLVPKLFAAVDPMHNWFRPKVFEPGLFHFLRIQKWKKYVPTYAPESFRLDIPLQQIARNMCISELVHTFIVLFSFLPLLFSIPFGELAVFLITSVISAMIDCVFILLQRYNRPRILRLLAKRSARIE